MMRICEPLSPVGNPLATDSSRFVVELNKKDFRCYNDLIAAVMRHAKAKYDTFGDRGNNTGTISQSQSQSQRGRRRNRYDRTDINGNGNHHIYGKNNNEKPLDKSHDNPYPRQSPPRANPHPQNPRYEVYTTLTLSYEEIWNW
ncbi:hypothetical protein ACLB2K_002343 [Fragaria x ananassa]